MNYEILLKQLEDFEGLELKPYKCTSDKTTIGLGRNLDDYGITKEEAYYLAQNNIDEIAVPKFKHGIITSSFCFKFKTFKQSMIAEDPELTITPYL